MRIGQLMLCAVAAFALNVASAETMVQVVGLFPNAAVLLVEGQRKLVKVGQVGPAGVKVLSADSRGARLEVDGQQRHYSLSREYNLDDASTPQKVQVSISRGLGGHYWVSGSIQSHPVQFLVDTGATSVAMNEAQARRLGLDYRVSGAPLTVSTAGGNVRGWRISLNSVKVGAIDILGVDAVVLEGSSPSEVLLGMSFLNRVRWREDNGVLVLESKL